MAHVQQPIPRTSHRTLRAAVLPPRTQRHHAVPTRPIAKARIVTSNSTRDDWLTALAAFALLLCVLALTALLIISSH